MTRSTNPAPPIRVLVAFASRHGGTRQVAATIAAGLSGSAAAGRVTTVLAPVELAPDVSGFDAVVLGSAVYRGHWLEPAVRYTEACAALLHGGSTWLFSSGLAPVPHQDPVAPAEVERLTALVGARGHRSFAGRLEPRLLSATEREDWAAVSTVTGDFRDSSAITSWSRRIAAEVTAAVPAAG